MFWKATEYKERDLLEKLFLLLTELHSIDTWNYDAASLFFLAFKTSA